jgi:hypothetical protein
MIVVTASTVPGPAVQSEGNHTPSLPEQIEHQQRSRSGVKGRTEYVPRYNLIKMLWQGSDRLVDTSAVFLLLLRGNFYAIKK